MRHNFQPNASLRIPRRLGNRHEDEETLRRSLPFVDYRTGVHGRLIVRDPITGLGDLPAEIDPLKGNRLRLIKEDTSNETPRNPILLQGDLGPEYNCLYTTKSLVCRERENRDIIALEGNLGEELDPLKQHGGKSKSFIQQLPVRDPIAGEGDFGAKEWDPIWGYEGRFRLNRFEEKKRDPITHSVPAINMGEKDPMAQLKQFPERLSCEDPINHTIQGKPIAVNMRGSLRHFSADTEHLDPITHRPILKTAMAMSMTEHDEQQQQQQHDEDVAAAGQSCDVSEYSFGRSSLRSFPQSMIRRNPITHEVISEGSASYIEDVVDDIPGRSMQFQRHKKVRNPISGEGLDEEDYIDLWKSPDNYCFRDFMTNTVTCPVRRSMAMSKRPAGSQAPVAIKPVHKPSKP